MKRHLHPLNNPNRTIWEEICSMENLMLAHKNARRGKSWYKEVKQIDENPEYYLKILQNQLLRKEYKTSEYETFYKCDGRKNRLIYKLPYFPDRVCQWAVLQVIEPILINTFTADTYSAIPARGIHACHYKLKAALQNDVPNCQYCLKLDVKQYYPSIDHNILKSKYRKLFKDENLLWLIDEIIDSTPGNKGIPIGNYLSQYSGNFYLSAFDHWIKEEKHIKHYFRYMDDIVILHSSKSFLHELRKEIDEYFHKELNVTIKDNWQVFPTYVRGIDYVGYRNFLNYSLLRKETCKQFKRKMNYINRKRKHGKTLTYSLWCTVNSYMGWLKHCNSYRLYAKYIEPLKRYAAMFYEKFVKGKGDKMINHGKVKSTIRPEEKVIDDYSVWINSDIKECTEQNGENEFKGYEYNQVQYSKDEYINLLDEKNNELESQTTKTQLALCELYELYEGLLS